MRRIVITTACLALLALPASAQAGGALMSSAGAGARVNVCDSSTHQMGVRATMPGGSLGERNWTRFGAEWLRPGGGWEAIPGSESPWIAAAPGNWLYTTSGFTRRFIPTGAPAEKFTVRGVVQLQWRGRGGTRDQLVVSGPCTF